MTQHRSSRPTTDAEPFSTGDAAYVLDEGLLLVRAGTPCELLLVNTPLGPPAVGRR